MRRKTGIYLYKSFAINRRHALPSAAFSKFESNMLVDVNRIIKSHSDLNHTGRGRRGLGHITRSGVFMLCAAWELYFEDLAIEAANIFIIRINSPSQLPLPVQKEIANAVRASKHQLKPIQMAGDGWIAIYNNHAYQLVNALNTPKSYNLDKLYKKLLGVVEISNCWSAGKDDIDDFVRARGDVAHRGRDAGYVTINKLKEYHALITRAVIETDNSMADHLQISTPRNQSPWRRRP